MQNITDVLQNGMVLATHNPGKLAEMRDLVAPLGIPITSAADHGLAEPEETGDSFLANARLKALAARDATGLAAVGDDSGLVAVALGDAPGIHSARWAGPERDFELAMRRLHDAVAAAGPDRRAYFISVVVLALPDGREKQTEGIVNGTLIWPPRGAGGFGYDPMFLPDGEDPQTGRSFAEMPFAEKQDYSHRGIALRAILAAVLADDRRDLAHGNH